MKDDFIRVTQKHDGTWAVLRNAAGLVLITFRLKAHAVAYARAISFSRKLTLFVDDKYGFGIRQSAMSLTYPLLLD